MQNIGASNAEDAFYRYKMPKLSARVRGQRPVLAVGGGEAAAGESSGYRELRLCTAQQANFFICLPPVSLPPVLGAACRTASYL